ncbi:MAG: hypothetical protein JWP25_8979 [Bradyrhizobium sp.]|nr:hypothetical protein [Bradyrhizobium sp.]
MTAGEWVLLVGLLAHAVAFYFSVRGINKRQDADHELLDGRTTQLIEEVRAAAVAKGRKQGRDEKVPK